MSALASKIRKENALGKRVDALASEFAQMKSLLINLQPLGTPLNEAPPQVKEKSSMVLPLSEEDAISIYISVKVKRKDSQSFLDDSQVPAQGSGEGVYMDQDVVRQALQVALACLNLDTARQLQLLQVLFLEVQQDLLFLVFLLPNTI